MNPLNINHIKIEKANLIKLRNQKLRKISNFFRVFEILLIVAVISRISFLFPLALTFKLSHDYLHRLSLILVSPPFVFVVGNAIVITLFINSGQLSNTKPCKAKTRETPKHDQHKKCTKSHTKKQRKTEESPVLATTVSAQKRQVVKIYHRSKSEKVKREKIDESCCQLRRSNTEVKRLKSCASSAGCCKDARESHYPEDHMSNEEFRRTIEDFIAKQQRFLRQEEGSSALDSDLGFWEFV